MDQTTWTEGTFTDHLGSVVALLQLQEKEFYPDPEDPPGGGENMMAGGGEENGLEEGGSQSMMGGGGVGPVVRWSLVPVEVMEYTPYGLPTIHAALDQGTGGGIGRLVSATDGMQLEGTTQTAAAAVALEPRFGPTPPNGQGQFTCQSSFGWRILPTARRSLARRRVRRPRVGPGQSHLLEPSTSLCTGGVPLPQPRSGGL